MKIRIIETGKIEELHIFTKDGVDWTVDLIGDYIKDKLGSQNDLRMDYFYLTRDKDNKPIYETHKTNYDWWKQYIDDFIADEEEIKRFTLEIFAEYDHDEAVKIIDAFTEESASNTFDCDHNDKQDALRKFRRHYLTNIDEEED